MTDHTHKDQNQTTSKSLRPEIQEEDIYQTGQSTQLPNRDVDNISNLQHLIGNQATQRYIAQRQPQHEAGTMKMQAGFVENMLTRKSLETGIQSDSGGERIQRYALTGGDASNLVEEKYASADLATGLTFSTFSSCIGVVGKKGDQIVGAHLVRVGADGEGPDVDSVVSALDGIEDGMMFGFLGNWEGNIKQGIAAGLGIYDWRAKESQNGWKVTWSKDDGWKLDEV